jgi:hypothetical protein
VVARHLLAELADGTGVETARREPGRATAPIL